jgi:hypothetical protein
MGITAYQIDNVIKAYNKQNKAKFQTNAKSCPLQDSYMDTVTLSENQGLTQETYKKISYNLMDILLKNKKTAT